MSMFNPVSEDVTPLTAVLTLVKPETDIVKLASAQKSLTRKVADWEDRITDALEEVEIFRTTEVKAGETLDEAEARVKEWRLTMNKVDRLSNNLTTYREMLETAKHAMKEALA